jgi:hypothetical protein
MPGGPSGPPVLASGSTHLLADVLQETLGGGFDKIQDLLKPIGATIVRVGDLGDSGVRDELEEQAYPPARMSGCSAVQDVQIFPVHGENEVELLEVSRLDNAGSKRRHIVAATAGRLPGSGIGRLTNVIAGGTSRIHLNLQLRSFTCRHSSKYRFRRG